MRPGSMSMVARRLIMGTNQPNKFLDPKSSESSLPKYSDGRRDDLIQMQYIRAIGDYWDDPAKNPVSGVYGGQMIDMSRRMSGPGMHDPIRLSQRIRRFGVMVATTPRVTG